MKIYDKKQNFLDQSDSRDDPKGGGEGKIWMENIFFRQNAVLTFFFINKAPVYKSAQPIIMNARCLETYKRYKSMESLQQRRKVLCSVVWL